MPCQRKSRCGAANGLINLIVLLVVLLGVSRISLAQVELDGFDTITESDLSHYPSPDVLDAEFESDVLTYRYPSAWRRWWLHVPQGFEMQSGSIDYMHLLVQSRLKVAHRVSPGYELRLHHFQEKDFSRDVERVALESIWWTDDELGIVLYGQPEHRKAEPDLGAALLIGRESLCRIRLFATSVDPFRFEHNDRRDHFSRGEPFALGLTGEISSEECASYLGSGVDLSYGAQWDLPVEWTFTDDRTTFEFERRRLRAELFGESGASIEYGLEANYEWKNLRRDAAALKNDRTWLTTKATFVAETSLHSQRGFVTLLNPVVAVTRRAWQTDHAAFEALDVTPLLWAGHQFRAGDVGFSETFLVGVAVTRRVVWGDWNERAVDLRAEPEDTNESRFNLRYAWAWGKDAEVTVLASFDVDGIRTRKKFEGASGQLRFGF